MVQQPWVRECRRNLICVDSYEGGVPKGQIYTSSRRPERFESLSQFLLRMEHLLDDLQQPQSYTEKRTFSHLLHSDGNDPAEIQASGIQATFELQVLFRQHSSWQGILRWREQQKEHSFRSVLELVMLLDSALRGTEGRGCA